MEFEEFIRTAWAEHADQPDDVAERLALSLDRVELPAHVAPFAGIVTHVFGEHLARYDDGVELLESMRRLPESSSICTELSVSVITRPARNFPASSKRAYIGRGLSLEPRARLLQKRPWPGLQRGTALASLACLNDLA